MGEILTVTVKNKKITIESNLPDNTELIETQESTTKHTLTVLTYAQRQSERVFKVTLLTDSTGSVRLINTHELAPLFARKYLEQNRADN